MDTIDSYLTEAEAEAEHAYRRAYSAEYLRLYDPLLSGDRQYVVYWSALAHAAGKLARARARGAATAGSAEL
ncbi:MAG: hypothetical protein M3281_10310 [Chloroflexota bacterium]|nr:hypothetical protein [Chloroflexota bacterium]